MLNSISHLADISMTTHRVPMESSSAICQVELISSHGRSMQLLSPQSRPSSAFVSRIGRHGKLQTSNQRSILINTMESYIRVGDALTKLRKSFAASAETAMAEMVDSRRTEKA